MRSKFCAPHVTVQLLLLKLWGSKGQTPIDPEMLASLPDTGQTGPVKSQ
jgi:hypothetical protein